MSNQDQYNIWHKENELTFVDPLSFQWYQTVYNLVPDLNHVKVLEIGCGRGFFAKLLLQRFPEIQLTAIDISDHAIAEAKRNITGIDFYTGDAEHLQFEILLLTL
jgi:trans-aconitate methyltransferase